MRNLGLKTMGLLLGLAAWGCGGGASSSGTGSVSGSVGGRTVAVADAVSTGSTDFLVAKVGYVALTSFAGACGVLGANQAVKNAGGVAFLVWDVTADGLNGTPPTAPGTYNLTTLQVSAGGTKAGKYSFGAFATYDGACAETDVSFTSGTVTLTKVSGGYAGSFDATTAANEHVTGSFGAGDCPITFNSAKPACN